jgi:hypothetical protein
MYLRIVFWAIALFLGAAEVWVVRHYVNPDGISYIEIATKYLQFDSTYAINSYWSPLYSWSIALAFLILRPSTYWEGATAHLVVFLAYVGTLAAFEFFLHEVVAARTDAKSSGPSRKLPEPVFYLGAYAAFLYAALSMVVVAFCSPDMIAFALLIATAALLLRIRRTGGSSTAFALLGLLCALMYLDRTALAPSGAASLLILVILLRAEGRPFVRPAMITVAAGLIISGPFVFALVQKTHRFTLGDSGTLNYAWEISGARRYLHWQGEQHDLGHPKHPTSPISSNPEAFSFAKPIPASYPPWFDPSYWYEGIRPKLKLKAQLGVCRLLPGPLTYLCSILPNYCLGRICTMAKAATYLVAGSRLGRVWHSALLRSFCRKAIYRRGSSISLGGFPGQHFVHKRHFAKMEFLGHCCECFSLHCSVCHQASTADDNRLPARREAQTGAMVEHRLLVSPKVARDRLAPWR